MLIKSIALVNFRQFYEKQYISFAESSIKNVTVIHGDNGSGKTALLHAFNWCLYGELNLPNPKNIINEHYVAESSVGDTVQAHVNIQMEKQGVVYSITRTVKAHKESEHKVIYYAPELSMEYRENGQSEIKYDAQLQIDRLLPSDLKSYFFFDGERIDNLSKHDSNSDIQMAIKRMMNLEIIERAIDHTNKAARHFRSEIKTAGDQKTVALIEELENKEEVKHNEEARVKQYEKNILAIDSQINELESRLKSIEEVRSLQIKIETNKAKISKINEEITNNRSEQNKKISQRGYLAFTSSLAEDIDKYLKEKGQDSYSTNISKEFIREIRDGQECICGTKFDRTSQINEHLLTLENNLKNHNNQTNILLNLSSNISLVNTERQDFFHGLKTYKGDELELASFLRKYKEENNEVSNEISNKDIEEVDSLLSKKSELHKQRDHYIERKSITSKEINDLDNKIKQLQKDREKAEAFEEKSQLAQLREKTCYEVEDAMKEILKLREIIVRTELQERISEVYNSFLRKGYKIHLTEDYNLRVNNLSGNEVGLSQGERQITSLSFIGAIVNLTREQFNKENKNFLEEGGIYPLVMDSPFGALDTDHRRRVAEGIHLLADQVVIIVSPSQWSGEVESEIKKKVGKEYILKYNDPRHENSEPYEYTQIIEVNNDAQS
ncbi:AAA family ATPase [Salipaludibacillus daqingensis]|uniref:AAA family ATPase n=1 Tax=Salipaludibacillus daqingensis TaxID=3041001 RepID=UPI002473BFA4|nr:AAA family ATPase [Salipaludibacillus daqingensis]